MNWAKVSDQEELPKGEVLLVGGWANHDKMIIGYLTRLPDGTVKGSNESVTIYPVTHFAYPRRPAERTPPDGVVWREMIEEMNPDALFIDGYDLAIIGYVEQAGMVLAAYDKSLLIEICMRKDNLPYEDAAEHVEFNIACAYLGKYTPVFASMTLGD